MKIALNLSCQKLEINLQVQLECRMFPYPTKNFGAAGDGGFIITNNKKLYKKIKLISNHGMDKSGKSIMPGRNSS